MNHPDVSMRLSRLLAFFRDMDWLDARRGRWFAGLLAGIGIGVIALQWACVFDRFGVPRTRDFSCFWIAARLALAGPAVASYDPRLLWIAEQSVYEPGGYEGFFYPPVFLMFCLAFAPLPYFAGLATYLGVTGAAFGGALLRAGRSPFLLAATLAFPAVLTTLEAGQNGLLTAAVLGGGLTLLDRRPRLAGLILGGMVVKPHLALAVPVALILGRRWTVLGHAALSAVLLVALSSLLFGWRIWPAFLDASSHAQAWLEQGSLDPRYRFLSVFSFARRQGGEAGLAYGIHALFVGVALLAVERTIRRPAPPAQQKSMIILATLLATPLLWPYDLTVLAFPLVWLTAEWAETGFPPWGKLFLSLGYILPLPALAGRMDLTLLGLLCLAGYLLWGVPRFARAEPLLAPIDKMLTVSAGS